MRLIDADELEEKITKWLKPSKPDEDELISIPDALVSTMMTIDEQPTAYDVDKVVAGLQSKSFERYGNSGMGGELVISLDDAVEIVERGEEERVS